MIKNKDAYMKPFTFVVNNNMSKQVDRTFGDRVSNREVLEKNKIKYTIPYDGDLEWFIDRYNIKGQLVEKIVKKSDGYYVQSEKGKNLGGPYKEIEDAKKRLNQVEYFKNRKKIDEEDTSKQTTRNKKLKRDIVRLAKQNGFEGIVNTKELTVHHIDDSKNEDGLKDNSYKNLWFIKSKNWKDRELLHKVLHFMDRNNVSYDALLNRLEDIKLYQYDEATNSFKEKTLSVFKESLKESNQNQHNKRGMNEDMTNDYKPTRSDIFGKFKRKVDESYYAIMGRSLARGLETPLRAGDDIILFSNREDASKLLHEINDSRSRVNNFVSYRLTEFDEPSRYSKVFDSFDEYETYMAQSKLDAEKIKQDNNAIIDNKLNEFANDLIVALEGDPEVNLVNTNISNKYADHNSPHDVSLARISSDLIIRAGVSTRRGYSYGQREVNFYSWPRKGRFEVSEPGTSFGMMYTEGEEPRAIKYIMKWVHDMINSSKKDFKEDFSNREETTHNESNDYRWKASYGDGREIIFVSKSYDDAMQYAASNSKGWDFSVKREESMPTLSGDMIEIPKTAEPIYTDMRMGVPMNFYEIDGVIYDNLGFRVSDEELKELGLKEIFKRKKRNEVSKKLKEGAEGKREPGYEYVIYDYTDEDGPNPIVAIRSTATEAEYTAMRWMGNDYITNGRAHPKYEDRLLTFEKVPKGKFKVGDDFYGPFDADYNKLESLKENNEEEIRKLRGRLLQLNKTVEQGEDPERFAWEKEKIFNRLDELGADYYVESLKEEIGGTVTKQDVQFLKDWVKRRKFGTYGIDEENGKAFIIFEASWTPRDFEDDVASFPEGSISKALRDRGFNIEFSRGDYTYKTQGTFNPRSMIRYSGNDRTLRNRFRIDISWNPITNESLKEALNWDYAVRADYLDRPKDFKKYFAIGTKIIEKETGDLFFVAKHWKNSVGRYKNFMYILPIEYWDNPKEGIKKHAGVSIDSLWFLSEYDFADGNPLEESYKDNALPDSLKNKIVVKEFNLQMVSPYEEDIPGAVLVIPNGYRMMNGSTVDASIEPIDEFGHYVNFSSVREAEKWLREHREEATLINDRDGLKLVLPGVEDDLDER